jgi:hypothetical protein
MAYQLNPLDGSLERVHRANEHLSDLRQQIQTVRRQQQDSITVQFDSNPPHKTIVGYFTETFVTMRIGVLIGEICYNLRSALDYLVFELAKFDSSVPQDGTQFPIVDTNMDFSRRQQVWLKGLNDLHIAAIERLQPYMGCNWSKALRQLSNRDKHREFAEIRGVSRAYIYTRHTDRNFDSIDAPIRHTPHPIFGEVDVKVYVTSAIQFGDGTPIVGTLEEIQRGIAATLTLFKPEFEQK